AYLVRRLLENTSNESWLRAGFSDGADASLLLAPPAASPSPGTPGEGRGGGSSALESQISNPKSHPHPNPPPEYRGRGSEGFRNEPLRDFSDPSQREAFAKSIAASTVPQI